MENGVKNTSRSGKTLACHPAFHLDAGRSNSIIVITCLRKFVYKNSVHWLLNRNTASSRLWNARNSRTACTSCYLTSSLISFLAYLFNVTTLFNRYLQIARFVIVSPLHCFVRCLASNPHFYTMSCNTLGLRENILYTLKTEDKSMSVLFYVFWTVHCDTIM